MDFSIEYIKSLINNKVEENLNLEYKAALSLEKNDKKTNEISKDVSAFANSDGGIIIYGIKEAEGNRHFAGVIDPIDRSLISKEWLEQVIQGMIRPRINGISIIPIEVDKNPNKVIYIVEIPKSNTAHQAYDKKYYKRFNFNSEPMYDYEIRDILNRPKNPEINLEFVIIKNTYEISQPPHTFSPLTFNEDGKKIHNTIKKEFKTEYELDIYALNIGIVLAKYINAFINFKNDFLIEKNNSLQDQDIVQIFADNTIRDIVDVKVYPNFGGGSSSIPKYGPSRYDPILPRQKLKIKTVNINENAITSREEINWQVYADNAEPKYGGILFRDIKIITK
jgi:hypothetical protein